MPLRPDEISGVPPALLVPLPATTHSAPARPIELAPVPIIIDPAFPPAAVPELKTSIPLLPATPALLVRSTIVPLLDAVPSPDSSRSRPPDAIELRPEDSDNKAPAPLVPIPPLSVTNPLRLVVATPEPMQIIPEFPPADDPELKQSKPLDPDAPPFADRTNSAPLLVAVPSLAIKLRQPPVIVVLRPEATSTFAPAPLVPLPAETLIAPPQPAVLAPVAKLTIPPLPVLDVPVLKTKHPLIPLTPEFELRKITPPLLVAVPSALSSAIQPPDCAVLRPALALTNPPYPLVPLPTVKLRIPAEPAVAAPDPINKAPLLPVTEVPELKINRPLDPWLPAFGVRTQTVPLLDCVPSPLNRVTCPPLATVLRPADTRTNPPAPLVPLPTFTPNDPAHPDDEAPEPNKIAPLFPEREEPELKTRDPLSPPTPLFAVRMRMMPLLVAVPSPLRTEMDPPLLDVLRQPPNPTKAPLPLAPLPAKTLTAPPQPAVATPLPNTRVPEFPVFADPLLNINCPLDPDTPPFIDCIEIWPLLDAVPSPPETATVPPVVDVLRPELVRSTFPAPLVPLPTKRSAAPPRPDVAACEPTSTAPEFSDSDVPELNTRRPLDPAAPLLLLCSTIAPLLDAVPSPVPM